MAHSTLAVLSSPDFPQLLRLAIDRAFDREISRVIETHDEAHLDCCAWESGETRPGACDSIPCIQKATVHHLLTEQEYCLEHFRTVSRG